MKIISLSSIPPRFDKLGQTLARLLQQTSAVDAIELYIPRQYRRFPAYAGEVPEVPEGVTLLRPEVDLGPATKVLHAVARHRDKANAQILFCDDDRAYAPDWAEKLFPAQASRRDEAVALAGWDIPGLVRRSHHAIPRFKKQARALDFQYRRARIWQILAGHRKVPMRQKPPRQLVSRSGYADILEGYAGAVVKPSFFPEQAFGIPDEAWAVDDVWLSGMLNLAGVGIWLEAGLNQPRTTEADLTEALFRTQVDNRSRAMLDARAIAYLRSEFGIWAGTEDKGPLV